MGTGTWAPLTLPLLDFARQGQLASAKAYQYGTDTSAKLALATVADEAGVTRVLGRDAIGGLKRVVEDPATLNYTTTYVTDVFGNVTTVTQGAQTRTFAFDSLNRLKSATNPETGTILYTYDGNGNPLTRKDNRNVISTMIYDALDRIKTKTYSGLTPVTPAGF